LLIADQLLKSTSIAFQVFGAEYLAVFFALAISLDLKVWVLYRCVSLFPS
jgi:hypothetical protein